MNDYCKFEQVACESSENMMIFFIKATYEAKWEHVGNVVERMNPGFQITFF